MTMALKNASLPDGVMGNQARDQPSHIIIDPWKMDHVDEAYSAIQHLPNKRRSTCSYCRHHNIPPSENKILLFLSHGVQI